MGALDLVGRPSPLFGPLVGACTGELGRLAALSVGFHVVIMDTLRMSCMKRHSLLNAQCHGGPDSPVRLPG